MQKTFTSSAARETKQQQQEQNNPAISVVIVFRRFFGIFPLVLHWQIYQMWIRNILSVELDIGLPTFCSMSDGQKNWLYKKLMNNSYSIWADATEVNDPQILIFFLLIFVSLHLQASLTYGVLFRSFLWTSKFLYRKKYFCFFENKSCSWNSAHSKFQ